MEKDAVLKKCIDALIYIHNQPYDFGGRMKEKAQETLNEIQWSVILNSLTK